jgi:hypothetical protein
VTTLDTLLALVTPFARLRPDERVRIAQRFTTVQLTDGESLDLVAEQPHFVVIVDGELELDGTGRARPLFAGDTLGEVELAAGRGRAGRLVARGPATVATLDRPALDSILAEWPAAAVPWLDLLGRELKWRNDLLREVSLAYAEGLPPARLESVLGRRRARLAHHRRSTVGSALLRTMRSVFTLPGTRPSFWVLVGALSALAAARTVVAFILAQGLQKHLFALIGSKVGHPVHVHHFNYGILLVLTSGVLLLWRRTRGAIRRLAFVFGFGLGLIVDEFALLWNLNPDYYQPSSRLAAALVVLALAQFVWFPSLWLAAGRRIAARWRRS